MAGATHPFFGNQYTDGGYEKGSFKFPEGLTRNVKERVMDMTGSKSDAISAPISSSSKVAVVDELDANGKWIIAGLVLAAAAAVGGYLVYRHSKKKNIIEIPNVGVCQNCGEPLTESELLADENNLYIVCKKCGERNYAHYHDEEGFDSSIDDEGLISPTDDDIN